MKKAGLFILGILIGALAMYFLGSQYIEVDQMGLNPIEPKGIISPEEAKTLDFAFNLKHRIINDALFKEDKTGDNRSSWWSLKQIESYITYSKKQAEDKGYILDGLRVYLGSYPSNKGATGLTTMFFIPTGYKDTSEGSMLTLPQKGGMDIPGGNGLNYGQQGDPPGINYPQ